MWVLGIIYRCGDSWGMSRAPQLKLIRGTSFFVTVEGTNPFRAARTWWGLRSISSGFLGAGWLQPCFDWSCLWREQTRKKERERIVGSDGHRKSWAIQLSLDRLLALIWQKIEFYSLGMNRCGELTLVDCQTPTQLLLHSPSSSGQGEEIRRKDCGSR